MGIGSQGIHFAGYTSIAPETSIHSEIHTGGTRPVGAPVSSSQFAAVFDSLHMPSISGPSQPATIRIELTHSMLL